MPDLSLVGTDDLVLALFARFDHCVVGLRRQMDTGEACILKHYHGDRRVGISLCSEMEAELNAKNLASYRLLEDYEKP